MESYNRKEEVKEKLKNLKDYKNVYSEKQYLLTKTVTTDLKNLIKEFNLRDPKNKQKKIIILLDLIYYTNSINLLQV